MLLLKIGAIYVIILSNFQKSQKYLYSGKNIKKHFLQLRCFDVLLHLKYKVFLCEPKIEFNKLAGGKALATDHREMITKILVACIQKRARLLSFFALYDSLGKNSHVGSVPCLQAIGLDL